MRKIFKKGELILKEGDEGNEAYAILSGSVEVYRLKDGKKVVLGVLGKDQIFGEMSMFDDRPRSANVMTLSDTEVNIIGRKDFNEIFYTEPHLLSMFLKNIFERLRHVDQTVIDLTMGMAGQNISENKIILTGLTPLALTALNNKVIEIDHFPYKIGRKTDGFQKDLFSNNDLYLNDEQPFSVSRNHLSIQCKEGQYIILDRRSRLGTYVNNEIIGGAAQIYEKELVRKSENIVILGNCESPYKFKVTVP
ncbi:MAG: hypothetical protein A2452_05130 [Candidatus Firestonebacteria bacterium RIFOXYC2_FULL_39_67]|nr:MAG: hypothetical protein A2536_10695 [Candidatus Firestonebacteria bacterium RIFOXYD2_FULL_39_29]OGF53036.1 MAG: hypothetical protein A2497_02560 [Candidatus Firestonebacteria bacterium RifOxyC12_full_39_7]OGF54508.1 MAG: hypothetical protein A2452_05130 [Candidatus Firestonebacteria bacterium RIFOXYC2_FULL_39_67]